MKRGKRVRIQTECLDTARVSRLKSRLAQQTTWERCAAVGLCVAGYHRRLDLRPRHI